jgi:hypothetical protein
MHIFLLNKQIKLTINEGILNGVQTCMRIQRGILRLQTQDLLNNIINYQLFLWVKIDPLRKSLSIKERILED